MLTSQCALTGSAVCCALFYFTVHWGFVFNAVFLALAGSGRLDSHSRAGAGNGGTDLILSGTVAVDLGQRGGEMS